MGGSKPEKVDNLEYCLRNLIAVDATPVDARSSDAESLIDLSRDNTQLLVNRIFSLARVTTTDGVFAILPNDDAISMPRMYPLPKPKSKTRWQLFAEARGIKKHKRSRMVFDKATNDWIPRWGYKSIKKRHVNNPPIVEVTEEDYAQEADPFEEIGRKKSVQKTRQKLRELRNKAEADACSNAESTLKRAISSTRGSGIKKQKPKGAKAKINIKRKATIVPLKEEREGYLASIKKLSLGK